jgi:Mn-dependent DtxR family transcriptional regulator
MRILRLCLHEAKTNRELAEELGVNPGTMLHHVRSLTTNGFLEAQEPRVGPRGAKELPYRATGLSWRMGDDSISPVLIETFLQEIEGLAPEQIQVSRLGLKLNEANKWELLERFQALLQEYADRDADPDGEPISLLFVEHPDLPREQRSRPR